MELTLSNITKQIIKTENKLCELKKLRKQICPHNNIEYNSWCDDDYAHFINRTYSDSYRCLDCNLYALSDNKNDDYNLLKNIYNNKVIK